MAVGAALTAKSRLDDGTSRESHPLDRGGPEENAAKLRKYDNLPARLVFFHAAVGFDDFIQVKDPAHLNLQTAGSDLIYRFLERYALKIFSLPRMACKTNSSRDELHWIEVVKEPFVSHNAGRANDSSR
jgi:hypothetical protein